MTIVPNSVIGRGQCDFRHAEQNEIALPAILCASVRLFYSSNNNKHLMRFNRISEDEYKTIEKHPKYFWEHAVPSIQYIVNIK